MTPISFFQHRLAAGEALVLRGGRDLAGNVAFERLDEQLRAQVGKAHGQLGGGLCFADVRLAAQEHSAGIDPGVGEHGGDAGLRFAVQDAPVDGRGAAVGGQQRGVDVDGAHFRHVQQRLGENLPKGGGDDDIRRERTQAGKPFFIAQTLELIHRHAALHGQLLDRAGGQLVAAPHGAVGLRKDAHDPVTRVQKALLRRARRIPACP